MITFKFETIEDMINFFADIKFIEFCNALRNVELKEW